MRICVGRHRYFEDAFDVYSKSTTGLKQILKHIINNNLHKVIIRYLNMSFLGRKLVY